MQIAPLMVLESNAMENILIVDDNKIFLKTLAFYLRSKLKNYNVMTAEDGEKAIKLMKSNPVSLVLTDLEMPKVDGYKVIAYAQEHDPAISVIIMTSAWSPELATLVEKKRIARYIEKPFQLEDFDRIIIEPLIKNKKISDARSIA